MSDFACFDSAEAIVLNQARMDHFLSLGIMLEGRRVLEVGCGVGHLSKILIERGAILSSVDARRENVDEAGRRVKLPHHISVMDIEHPESVGGWNARFHVVFAYGLLYHLTNPIQALRNMKAMLRPDGLLAIESIVMDYTGLDPREASSTLPIALLVAEADYAMNQGVSNVALWPSKAFIAAVLYRIGFTHVYQPATRPNHPEFWLPSEEPSTFISRVHREIFVASNDVNAQLIRVPEGQ